MIIAVVIVVSLIGITIVIAFMVLSLEVMQILEMTNMTKQVLVNGEYYWYNRNITKQNNWRSVFKLSKCYGYPPPPP